MEIHYIWIENYNNLKAKPVTLSSKYIFKTNLEKVNNKTKQKSYKRKGTITISKNLDYIDNFFEKENITNVSAIIGKNGTGKTSILDFIKNHLPKGLNANIENNLIIAYSIFENGQKKNFIIYPENWDVKIVSTNINFNEQKYTNGLGNIKKNFNSISKISNTTYLYYTFNLDYKIEIENWGGLINLSTATLLCQPKKNMIERWVKNKDIDKQEASTYDLDLFMQSELEKSIQLLISDSKDILPFDTPDFLNISILTSDKNYFKKGTKIYKILQELENKNKKLTSTEQAINNFYIAIFTNFLVTTFHYTVPKTKFEFDFSIKNESIKDFILNFFNNLYKIEYITENNSKVLVSRHRELSKIIPEFIKCFEDYLSNEKIILKNNLFYFSLSKNEFEDFSYFFNLYFKSKGLTNFLSFSWRGLSTGQQSFLSFASRFYFEKEYSIGKENLKNLIIMIDEGDAGFHPKWQRRFFKDSLNFLANLFNNNKIQLIYTANAPYIISDLPKNHITFIENKESEIIIKEKDNDREQTFGQNIHTLLSNSFFMDNGLIGDFAKEKINRVIDIIDKNKKEEKEYAKKIITIIGDNLIKRRLNDMYLETFEQKNFANDNEYLQWLREETERIELKNKNNDKNH